MKIVYDEKCLMYYSHGHPEAPFRVSKTYELLREKNFEFVKPPPASESDVLLAHSQKLIRAVKNGYFFEPDTPFYENIFDIALLSCGGAILSAMLAKQRELSFSLMRPPGHHATKDTPMGFCYFNNIAVAVLKVFKSEKVAVIDFDCHHGNGTEEILKGRDKFLYVSLHQNPGYPGTGLKSHGNIINFPLKPGTTGDEYLKVFEKAILEVEKFKPDFIGVSAGFDTFRDDPITDMGLDIEDFEKIAELVKSLNRPVFSVLEGGYSQDLPHLIYSYLKGFG